MLLKHLTLLNFRNYLRLEMDFPPGVSVFQGSNAQGKTNLLEAIYLLATARSPRAVAEREFINWSAQKEQLPFARLLAKVQKGERDFQLEIVLRPKVTLPREEKEILTQVQKLVRINGIVRRTIDLIGQLKVVMFSPQDIELIGGEPALRRRWLDIANSQTSQRYLKVLQYYNKVLLQRNHLLRRIAEHQAHPDELDFWDQELVKSGAYLIFQRQQTITELNKLIEPIHEQLSGGKENLRLAYRKTVGKEVDKFENVQETEQMFQEELKFNREKELARGVSLVGPHRDDLRFLLREVDMGAYGSRGQQRTITLSLKLAEAKFILAQTKESPVLLLDDVLSELDMERRYHLLQAVSNYQQVLITATDLDRFLPDFLAQAAKFKVEEGRITPLN